jgi:C-terminal processing protease CtpA/Prc
VVRSYFDREVKVTESKSAEYEILPDNIGYVFLSTFSNDNLKNEFPKIIEYFKTTNGIIIDIRQKVGGNTAVVRSILSYFLTEPLDWPTFYCLGELVEPNPVEPNQYLVYTNPVVVIINGSTFSAGELTTEMLKQLPAVTVIGNTSGGGGGTGYCNSSNQSIPDYRLPSGKVISVPTGFIIKYNGETYEWNGVSPEIFVDQTEADILSGRDKQLEFAINLLK